MSLGEEGGTHSPPHPWCTFITACVTLPACCEAGWPLPNILEQRDQVIPYISGIAPGAGLGTE